MDEKVNYRQQFQYFHIDFIIFPNTTVLNIFEPRYIQMIDDSMKSHRMIGMVQQKKPENY